MSLPFGLRSLVRGAAIAIIALASSLQTLTGCGELVEVGIDDELVVGGSGGGGATGGGGSLSIAGTAGAGDGGELGGLAGAPPCIETRCAGQLFECGDCLDNDQDGYSDTLDPECLGPCDDDELGLSTGLVVGAAEACRQDCYFDSDNGLGNDQCEWSHSCDPLSLPPDYPPSGASRCAFEPEPQGTDCAGLAAEQSPVCLDKCLPLAPNGCDCFGCCELPDGEFHFVGRGRGDEGCQLDALTDRVACPLCTPVRSCFNPCDSCEVCVGRPLPMGCSSGAACPQGQAACVDSNEPCDFGEYCITGCCVRAPEPI